MINLTEQQLIEGYKKCSQNKENLQELLNTGVGGFAKEELQSRISETTANLQKYLVEINKRGILPNN